jgi:hypothetical protein
MAARQLEDLVGYLQNSYDCNPASGTPKRGDTEARDWVIAVDAQGSSRYVSANLASVLGHGGDDGAEGQASLAIADLFSAYPELVAAIHDSISVDCCFECDMDVQGKTLLLRVFPFDGGGLLLLRDVSEVRKAQQQARDLSVKVVELTNKLEERKLIERAKGILMQGGMTEQEAFRRIQKAAMDSGRSAHAIAEALILSDKMKA